MKFKWIFFIFFAVAAFSSYSEGSPCHGACGRHGTDGAIKHRDLRASRPSVKSPTAPPNLNEKF